MKSHFSHEFFSLLVLSLALSLSVSQLHAQQPKVIYLYDDLGRLVQVVNQNNECATYEYDAVGNLLRITRSTNCLQPPTIDSLSQDAANAGDTTCITIRGTNFLGATVTTDNPDVEVSRVRVSETSINVCLIISPFVSLGSTRIIITTTAGVIERTITINARTLAVTQSTSIGRFDRSFEGTNLTIQGPATITIDGPHRFRSLTLRNNAIVTHSVTTNFSTSKLDLTVDTALTIDATSRIDVTALGFLGGGKSGNPFVQSFNNSGMTVGFQRGSTNRSGGSYGGLGAPSGEGFPNPAYGDFRDPNDLGSGGAAAFGAAGNGGGLIRIVAQTLQLGGAIKADGETSAFYAGGSGGGIRINVETLSGTGQIAANGGNGQRDNGGGGGGGRIAVYYQNAAGFDFAKVTAFAGIGNAAPNGGAGTVFLQGPGRENGELLVDNNGISALSLSTPLISQSLGTLRIRRGAGGKIDGLLNLTGTLEVSSSSELALAANQLTASTIQVTGSSTVTHLFTTASASFKVDLSANSLTVDATSRIDVTARGFLGGGRSGNPFLQSFNNSGMTVRFQRGSTNRSGGSYGGLGAPSGEGFPNPAYGDFRDPNDLGSGGAAAFGTAGNGGGLIRIVAQTLQLDGVIRADGESPTTYAGGSGGGIRIDVGMLNGLGSISSNGGNGQRDNGGGGGGGRIAVYYQNAAGFDFAKVTAFAGIGNAAPNGGAGTVYLQGPGRENGELIADNNNLASLTQSTPIVSTPLNLLTLTNLRVKRAARVRVDDQVNLTGTLEVSFGVEFIPAKRVVASTIDVNNGSVVTQLPTTVTAFSKVDLSANSLTVDATSRIDVTALGFLGGGRPGNPLPRIAFNNAGMTIGFQIGSTGRSGGGYGGLGGAQEGTSNLVYGDFRNPNEPGSGGAAAFGDAGNGGGLIRIVAQTLQLDGIIKTDGETPTFYGGGSGGGIRIDVGTLSGLGSISSNGGNGQRDNGGGGGGGRIAVYYQNAAGFNFSRVSAFGGAGNFAPNGGAGTIYLQGPGRENGEIIVDNNSMIAPLTPLAVTPSTLAAPPTLRVRRTGVLIDNSNAFTNLALESGALMTHSPTTAIKVGRLDISVAGALTIDATSKIDVTALGFLGGGKPGNPLPRIPFNNAGMTIGFQSGSTGESGGSYGGLGGSFGGTANPLYGDFKDPNEPGSGGAALFGEAGNGGGLIRIVAQTLVLDGMIKADGETPTFYGGGSGGGIKIDVGTLMGTGQITANGGNGRRDNGGGGGGGRVAVYYQDAASFDLTKATASGGTGNFAPNGQNGSVHLEQRF